MSEVLEKYLENAIYLENRGFKEESRKYYDYLKINLNMLDKNGLQRVSQFYDIKDESQVIFEATRRGIELGGDAKVLVPLYIKAWEYLKKDYKDLEWLLNRINFDHLTKEYLMAARYLFLQGDNEKAYIMALEIGEKAERLFRQNPSEYELYIDSLLHLVECEYTFRNYTQARFHLRKLVYLKSDRLIKINEITYWSILLDEITNLISRMDWETLSHQLQGEIALISEFYVELSDNHLSRNVVNQIQKSRFQNLELEKKRIWYTRLINKIIGRTDWQDGIEREWVHSSKDLLSTLLYADSLSKTSPDSLKAFWEEEFLKHADRKEAIRAYASAINKSCTVDETKDLDDCSITFFGGGEKIGGTSILVSVKGHHLLLDAGMHLHENEYYPDYSLLAEKGIGFEEIDALLITHAHMDHTGAVPYVHKRRPDLPIFATAPTVQLMKILLTDAVRINKNTESDMYSEVDVHNSIHSIKTLQFNEPLAIPSKDSAWKVTYYQAGHILGAGAIHIEFKGISILFTGDYSVDDQRTVQGIELPDNLKIDVLITESTYGFLPTNASIDRKRQESLFISSVKRTMNENGTMLIPAFAVGRAQEIVMILKKAFTSEKYLPFDLFLDGRVIDVCHVYERFLMGNNYSHPDIEEYKVGDSLFFGGGVQSAKDIYSTRKDSLFTFQDFIDDYITPGNNCIVASSGMLTENSASARYAEQLIEDKKNSISFTGYMDEESPGQHVLRKATSEGLEKINIQGREREISARIDSFRLSAHASREQILQLILKLQPAQVFLMHGEHTKQYSSVQTICEGNKVYPTIIDLLSFSNRELQTIPAFNGRTYSLKKRG